MPYFGMFFLNHQKMKDFDLTWSGLQLLKNIKSIWKFNFRGKKTQAQTQKVKNQTQNICKFTKFAITVWGHTQQKGWVKDTVFFFLWKSSCFTNFGENRLIEWKDCVFFFQRQKKKYRSLIEWMNDIVKVYRKKKHTQKI